MCGDEPVDVPGLADGVYVEAGWAERQADAPTTHDVERLRAVVATVPSGQRERAVAAVHALASCDGASSSGAGRSPATSAVVSGVEVVTLPTTYQQKAKPHTVHRVHTAEVVDGLAVLCVADGTSLEKSLEMATGCTTRGRESVDVIRGGPSARGSIASAAALAARLRPTKGRPVQANPVPVLDPCYGSTVRPPTAGVVATKLETGEMASVPALLVVQPFDDPASAQRELARYRGLTATCVGEYVLYEATASTPEYGVTRLRPQPTSSGDGGVRFPSFFGTATKHTGTSQVVEVFTVGPHLVFAAGEAKDLEAATKLVDAAIADVLVPRG
ncbi:hypothetical protein G7075_04665 [Phycicoccus sp. HDW14]|uniref:hypothetical protein n=1 Tax=Phycicoccus sp. HDW14 TaxID=2714941 RepID=UPI00140C447B|nr:hypothetical protein [Phycicoccus sp. HDW14]QIM20604.1 hypothetical protein G7075_04665 [Phycicoccus sp. HDW14]